MKHLILTAALAFVSSAALAEMPAALDHQPQGLEQIVDAQQVAEAYQIAQAFQTVNVVTSQELRYQILAAMDVGGCHTGATYRTVTNWLNPRTDKIERVTIEAYPNWRACQIRSLPGDNGGRRGFTAGAGEY